MATGVCSKGGQNLKRLSSATWGTGRPTHQHRLRTQWKFVIRGGRIQKRLAVWQQSIRHSAEASHVQSRLLTPQSLHQICYLQGRAIRLVLCTAECHSSR